VRVGRGGAHGQGADAGEGREAPGWPRRPRGRLRRRAQALPGAKLLGAGLGDRWLLHDPLRLLHGLEPGRRPVDGAAGGVSGGAHFGGPTSLSASATLSDAHDQISGTRSLMNTPPARGSCTAAGVTAVAESIASASLGHRWPTGSRATFG